MFSGSVVTPILALAFVVVLVLGLGRLVRHVRLPLTTLGRHADRRLSVSSHLPIDSKRRLLIVRCDEREAVLLLGPSGDTVLGWLDGSGR